MRVDHRSCLRLLICILISIMCLSIPSQHPATERSVTNDAHPGFQASGTTTVTRPSVRVLRLDEISGDHVGNSADGAHREHGDVNISIDGVQKLNTSIQYNTLTPIPNKEVVIKADNLFGKTESYPKRDIINGYIFAAEGVADTTMHPIRVSLVHDFTLFIEEQAKLRMVDPFNDTDYCVVSPALELQGQSIIAAFRVFRCPHRIKTKRNSHIKDLVFVQEYDRKLRPRGHGYFLGVGYSRFSGNQLWDGPQDPRAFSVNSTVFLMFHLASHLSSNGDRAIQKPIIWDLERHLPIVPELKQNVMLKSEDDWLYDKNWMPIIVDDELYFVQTLDPLLVIKCDFKGRCDYINPVDDMSYPFGWSTALRGGSQFQLYRWPYYIGAVHSLFRLDYKKYVYREYGAHLVVLKMPGFRFVYSTDLLRLNKELYKNTPRPVTFFSDFFFPTSLLVESEDTVLVGGHINDDKSVLLRVYGIEALMGDVMASDITHNPQELLPKANIIQNFFRSHFTQYYTTAKIKSSA